MVYEARVQDLNRWLVETADGFEAVHFLADGTECKYLKRDPARAAELLIKMAEHFVPKLAHTEITGPDGERLVVNVTITGLKREERA